MAVRISPHMEPTLKPPAITTPSSIRPGLAERFFAFVAESHPFALDHASVVFRNLLRREGGDPGREAGRLDALRAPLSRALRKAISLAPPAGTTETTPGVSAASRMSAAVDGLVDACDGFLRRESLSASLTAEERLEILRGIVLTRAIDNRLKAFFTGSEVRYRGVAFQGKGFRSLGQEAIYAAATRLRRGEAFRENGEWKGDVVAPLIRDLGIALAMNPGPEFVRMVLNAQMGKDGSPMDGKDLHIGDFAHGVLPAAAPLAISSLTVAGLALAFAREGEGRVAVSLIGEGGSSLGEWHEAINLCAARRLPAVFCVQNNQTALSTPPAEQSAVRAFADKAAGYGIPGITLDGTDPDAIAAAFAWAAERARAGKGPALLELISMRMCGHAHHDDMLYLGRDPQPAWTYPALSESGYAARELYEYWSRRDPIALYAARLSDEGILGGGDLSRFQTEADALVEREARAVIEAPWPEPASAGEGVLSNEPRRTRVEPLDPARRRSAPDREIEVEPAPPFDPKGSTFLDAVALGVGDALAADPRVFVFGEDVGGKYGNAFLLLRPLLERFGDRILNSPLSEGAVLGACIGAALAGQRPVGEMQFNDFVATGFNQLVNSAAKIRYRWGGRSGAVFRWSYGCRGAGCGTPARTTARTPKRGSTGLPA